uniref:Lipoyl-binding domain-containing protein n=1 Tax=Octactis speculum TaxID=3111310 RepID=A0A7S2B9T3_9STRA|mmetsp:Transcript_20946/g.28492  ORF Transcript_20946/g.28492 Transcript_20946/m.28492 type:complete len:158 (+) Transcript_20946:54-527(+)
MLQVVRSRCAASTPRGFMMNHLPICSSSNNVDIFGAKWSQPEVNRCRNFATFQTSNLPAPEKESNEIFIRTPFVGDGLFQHEMGVIGELLVKVGDTVKVDETVAVIDTDKASLDVRSTVTGTITRLLIEEEDEVWELHPIIVIEPTDPGTPRVRYKK